MRASRAASAVAVAFQPVDSTDFDPSFDLYGGGGLVSTVDDLARFYRALFTGRVLAKKATLRTMLGNPRPIWPADLGLGIFALRLGTETCYGHQAIWGITVSHCPRTRVTIASSINQATHVDNASLQLHADMHRLATANAS